MKFLLDTYTWVWMHLQPERLSDRVVRVLEAYAEHEFLLSVISVGEFCVLVAKKRIEVRDHEAWVADALDVAPLRIADLTPEIACAATRLNGSLHADPADRIIIATAREHKATILTKDARVSAYEHVAALW